MSGRLKKSIDEDGIRGVTSNPKIFKEAIAGGEEYEDEIRSLAQKNKSKEETYQKPRGVNDVRKKL